MMNKNMSVNNGSNIKVTDEQFMMDIYTNYYGLVFNVIKANVLDVRNYEDIMQSVWERLIRRVSTLRILSKGSLIVYIKKTTLSVCYNTLSKHKKIKDNESALESEAFVGFEPVDYRENVENTVITTMEIKRGMELLTKLPQRHQDILYFKYFLEYSDEEIAQVFNIGKNSVRQALTRARRMAKDILDREEKKTLRMEMNPNSQTEPGNQANPTEPTAE